MNENTTVVESLDLQINRDDLELLLLIMPDVLYVPGEDIVTGNLNSILTAIVGASTVLVNGEPFSADFA